jgi:hypothetical protein
MERKAHQGQKDEQQRHEVLEALTRHSSTFAAQAALSLPALLPSAMTSQKAAAAC